MHVPMWLLILSGLGGGLGAAALIMVALDWWEFRRRKRPRRWKESRRE